MLTEGAKPGTPHINPVKIYPDGFDLYIQVPVCRVDEKTENEPS